MHPLPVLSLLGLLFATPTHAVPAVCNEPFDIILQEQNSGILNARTQVIDNDIDWCTAWDEIYTYMFPAPPCDTTVIDFTTQIAVLVALGDRWDTCYNVTVGCAIRTPADRIRVAAIEFEPGPMCICGDAIVDPVVVAAIDRPVNGVQFKSFQWQTCP